MDPLLVGRDAEFAAFIAHFASNALRFILRHTAQQENPTLRAPILFKYFETNRPGRVNAVALRYNTYGVGPCRPLEAFEMYQIVRLVGANSWLPADEHIYVLASDNVGEGLWRGVSIDECSADSAALADVFRFLSNCDPEVSNHSFSWDLYMLVHGLLRDSWLGACDTFDSMDEERISDEDADRVLRAGVLTSFTRRFRPSVERTEPSGVFVIDPRRFVVPVVFTDKRRAERPKTAQHIVKRYPAGTASPSKVFASV